MARGTPRPDGRPRELRSRQGRGRLELAAASLAQRAGWLGYLGLAAARMGLPGEALERSAELQALEAHPDMLDYLASRPALERAEIAGALGDCESAASLLVRGFDRGLGRQMIHRRLGLSYCRDHPALLRLAEPQG